MTYSAALAESLRAQQEKREPDGYWFPSQLGGCDRKNVLQHIGVEPIPFDDRTLRLFWLGDKIHEALQRSFPFEVIGHELRVRNEEYKVSGRIDTLARVDGVLEAVEYKSVHDKKFSYGGLPEWPHVLQVGSYLTWPAQGSCDECEAINDGECGWWHGNGMDKTGTYSEHCAKHACKGKGRVIYPVPTRGRVVYWSKNDARIEEYIIEASEELSEAVKAEYSRLESLYQRYLRDGTLPDALPLVRKKVRGKSIPMVDWRVNYCSYKGTGNCCGDKVDEVRTTDRTDSGDLPGLPDENYDSA